MSKGFTLIEVILAIFIFSVGVLGMASVLNSGVSSVSLVKSRLQAVYLSQEGIEVVRNIRDSNWLAQRTDPEILWDEDLAEGDWQLDYQSQSLSFYSDNYLNLDSNNFFSYLEGEQTKFKRKLTISDKNADYFKITSRVEWEARGKTYNIEASDYLYNWK